MYKLNTEANCSVSSGVLRIFIFGFCFILESLYLNELSSMFARIFVSFDFSYLASSYAIIHRVSIFLLYISCIQYNLSSFFTLSTFALHVPCWYIHRIIRMAIYCIIIVVVNIHSNECYSFPIEIYAGFLLNIPWLPSDAIVDLVVFITPWFVRIEMKRATLPLI